MARSVSLLARSHRWDPALLYQSQLTLKRRKMPGAQVVVRMPVDPMPAAGYRLLAAGGLRIRSGTGTELMM